MPRRGNSFGAHHRHRHRYDAHQWRRTDRRGSRARARMACMLCSARERRTRPAGPTAPAAAAVRERARTVSLQRVVWAPPVSHCSCRTRTNLLCGRQTHPHRSLSRSLILSLSLHALLPRCDKTARQSIASTSSTSSAREKWWTRVASLRLDASCLLSIFSRNWRCVSMYSHLLQLTRPVLSCSTLSVLCCAMLWYDMRCGNRASCSSLCVDGRGQRCLSNLSVTWN